MKFARAATFVGLPITIVIESVTASFGLRLDFACTDLAPLVVHAKSVARFASAPARSPCRTRITVLSLTWLTSPTIFIDGAITIVISAIIAFFCRGYDFANTLFSPLPADARLYTRLARAFSRCP